MQIYFCIGVGAYVKNSNYFNIEIVPSIFIHKRSSLSSTSSVLRIPRLKSIFLHVFLQVKTHILYDMSVLAMDGPMLRM